MFANKRATACSNLLSMNSAQRNLTSYRSKQHRDTGELLALAAPPERLSSVPQHSRQTSRTLSQPNVCVLHVHRILSLPERGTATCIPRTLSHRFLSPYTRTALLFIAKRLLTSPRLPVEFRHMLHCAAFRGILTPTRATMARPDATRNPGCT